MLSDSEKARLVITLSGFALGGKKVDNDFVISKGYTLKTTSGKPGFLFGVYGYLHTLFMGGTLSETLWYNLLTLKDIQSALSLPKGVGTPPWEAMPTSENDEIALNLKNSLISSLLPMSKFYLLDGEQIHFTDGIDYSNHKEGGFCTTTSIDRTKKDYKALWTDTKKLPWRELTSMLSFLGDNKGYDNFTLCKKDRILSVSKGFFIWSGGLALKDTSGEQYISGSDDYLESEIGLDSDQLKLGGWYTSLEVEMKKLNELQKTIYGAIRAYHKSLGCSDNDSGSLTAFAANDFWQRCEPLFDGLLAACYDKTEKSFREKYRKIAEDIYNFYCPRQTARQLAAWASCRINYARYLERGDK
jgi:CRISPR system Cascade subunit CasA